MGMDLVAKKPKNENYTDYRFNVWGWRPVWDYCIQYGCEKYIKDRKTPIISIETAQNGHYNSGHLVSEEEAKKLAEMIKEHHLDGTLDKHHAGIQAGVEEAKLFNAELEKRLASLKKQAEKEAGKSDLAPINYPETYKKRYDELVETRDWRSYYPFHRERMLDFAIFMEQSGGFEIW